jgi:hypothetical protein
LYALYSIKRNSEMNGYHAMGNRELPKKLKHEHKDSDVKISSSVCDSNLSEELTLTLITIWWMI